MERQTTSLKGTEEDEDESYNALEKRGRSQKPMVLPEDVVEAEVVSEDVQVRNKNGKGEILDKYNILREITFFHLNNVFVTGRFL